MSFKANARKKARVLYFVAYPGVNLLELTAPQTVFWRATMIMNNRGLPGYEQLTLSLSGGPITTAEGVTVETSAPINLPHKFIDAAFVPGASPGDLMLPDCRQLVGWIIRLDRKARRIVSVGNGAFLVGHAGLLRGERAVTHWASSQSFQSTFSDVMVEADIPFIRQGRVWTSAGVSASIDLALMLVEHDCGNEVAVEVAREMFMPMRGAGGQSQAPGAMHFHADNDA